MFLSKFRLIAGNFRRLSSVIPPRACANFSTTINLHAAPDTDGSGGDGAGDINAADKLSPIVDIDMDVVDDPEFGGQMHMSGEDNNSAVITELGVPLAPVDIDAWADEEEEKQGTVEIEAIEEKLFEYPPIPQSRPGCYKFQGIKVYMPQRLLTPQTYRYRLDPEEHSVVGDDMRICRFDK